MADFLQQNVSVTGGCEAMRPHLTAGRGGLLAKRDDSSHPY